MAHRQEMTEEITEDICHILSVRSESWRIEPNHNTEYLNWKPT